MHNFPQTRNSLLLRIKDVADAEAWAEFSAIYRPVVYRIARRKGMQDADAQDVAQTVLVSLSSVISKWDVDTHQGRFRNWLSRVACRAQCDR